MTYQPPPQGFRTFLIVWATQSVSVFGSALTLFALNIWLAQSLYPAPEQKAQLALALSALNLAFAVPVVLGAPLAGAWADRHDRKRTMIAMDLTSGAFSLVLAWLVLSGALQIPSLLALIVLASIAGAFHGSAFDTCYAMLVPPERLPRANGMMQTMWGLSGILAPAVAASIIAVPQLARGGAVPGALGAALARLPNGTALVLGVDAASFVLAGLTLIFLYIPSPRRSDLGSGKARVSLWADVRQGGLYIWHRRPLLWLLSVFAVTNFLSVPIGILTPLVVKFNLAGDWVARGFSFETALAFINTVGSIGGLAGGVIISAWGGLKRRRVYGVVLPLALGAAAQIVYGLSGMLYLTAGMAFIYLGLIPFANAHSQTIWQMQTPPELQGRVFAVRRLIAQFSWPLGTALAGWFGGLFNAGTVITVMGALLIAFSVAQLFNPYLLRVEDKPWLDMLAARVSAENA